MSFTFDGLEFDTAGVRGLRWQDRVPLHILDHEDRGMMGTVRAK
jgi:hypothetical protein